MTSLRVLSLFSGIGGLDLGLERTGAFRTVAFCEADRFCRRVLRKHWPGVRIYHDVRDITALLLEHDGLVSTVGGIDVICGGFPCQDVSLAGRKAGIDAGRRSGLWSEYARLIGELRPRLAIVENVSRLLVDGMGRVLGDLAEVGYDAEWCVLSAAGAGAAHLRERVFVVTYPSPRARDPSVCEETGGTYSRAIIFDDERSSSVFVEQENGVSQDCRVSDPDDRRYVWQCQASQVYPRLARPRGGNPGAFVNPHRPFLGREVHGLSRGVDRPRQLRIRALGNVVVPQVAEQLGYMILDGGMASLVSPRLGV